MSSLPVFVFVLVAPFVGLLFTRGLRGGADKHTANSRRFSAIPISPPRFRELADRGEKIRFYEDLYRQYSRLDFTRIMDRSVAILGLEQRMVRDFKAWGGYGIFDDKSSSLLPRGLLWRRTDSEAGLKPLRRILPEGQLPSWSWMAYDGPIDYLDVPFGEVHWFAGDIVSPWSGNGAAPGELRIAGRPFLKEPVAPDSEQDFELVLDDEDATTEGWEF